MSNIIGFAGRMGSGKTELASICELYGYKKIYFALPLKKLCSKMLKITIEELNILKRNNTPINFVINDEWIRLIHEETNIPINDIKKTLNGKIMRTVRDLLQFIGTNIIREFYPNWHVEQIKSMIKPNEKYVIDDVRFNNEKELIENLGGTCWFIIRPTLQNVSNHESEITLNWRQFENIIVNDKSINYLKYHWEIFMSKGHDYSLKIRKKLYEKLKNNKEITNDIQKNIDEEYNMFNLQNALLINNDEFNYTTPFLNDDIKNVEEINGEIYITYKDNTKENIKNNFIIEDLKKYI